MKSDNYAVAVIGSGVSAMTSAILFAKKGKKTAIFEQAPHIAPLIAGFDKDGVHFETGFHYSGVLGDGEIGDFLFKKLGLNISAQLCDKNGYDEAYLLESKRAFKFPFGRKLIEERLIEYFPDEKEGIKEYIDLVYKTIDRIPFLNFHKREYKTEDFFYLEDDKITLSEVLNKFFKNEELKSLLSFSSILYGTPPSKASFVLHCCCSGIMFESVWKIKGGAGVLVKEFKKVLAENKVDIFCNKRAVKIEIENNKKKIVFSDGSFVLCDICVSSIHPKEFIKISPQGVYRDKNIERIKALPETPGFFVLYGKLKDASIKINNIGFLNQESFKKDHKDFYYVNFSDSKPQGVCIALSAASDENLWNMDYEQYLKKKENIISFLKKEVAKRNLDILNNIEFIGCATPRTFKRYVNYYGSYGIMHAVGGANILPITKIPGLFVVGQATVAPGLIGAMISSFLLDKIIDRNLENKDAGN